MSNKKLKFKRSLPIGQTLETNDLYLPYKKNKKPASKRRPVIIAGKQISPKGIEEYSVIPGSTQDTPNTTEYKKYGIEYYRHNLEVRDNEGNPISQNEKFRISNQSSKLPNKEVDKIRNHILNHTKFSSENRAKVSEFNNRYSLTEETTKFLSEEKVRLKKVSSQNINKMLQYWVNQPKSKYKNALCKIYKNELNSRNKKSRG